MISKRFCVASLTAAVLCATVAGARAQGQRPLKVSLAPAAIYQGGVVSVRVDGALDRPVTGTVFGREVPFDFDDAQAVWHALIGVDLDTTPATYPLHVQESGSEIETTRSLRILRRAFRVRRLNVPGTFVDPPTEALVQIEADSKALAEVYAIDSAKQWRGAFVRPLDGMVTSNFGARSYYNGQPRSPHAGVDFVARTGTAIRAPNAGTIVLASSLYFTGNTVVIDHGHRLFSVFAHLSEIHVQPGITVGAGATVGLVGATGRVTGPHLHWSIRLDGARVDPLSLIAATE
jgi:murein DD-endopeptidase MepM/ murein hydrolase activator NlpD